MKGAPGTDLERERLLARLYDWEHDEFHDDLDLYEALAHRVDGSILEVACGSGRVLGAVARFGRELVGIDTSAAMLERARDRLRDASGPVRLFCQDMHADLPGGPFGLAILALSGFGYSLLPGRQVALLHSIAGHLRPDGLLALDLVSPGGLLDQQENVPIMQRHGAIEGLLAEGSATEVTKWMVQTLHVADETIELFSIYDLTGREGRVCRLHDVSRFRFFSRFEIELLLDAAGFQIEGLYGNYELSPFHDESKRMIVIARPAPLRKTSRAGGRNVPDGLSSPA